MAPAQCPRQVLIWTLPALAVLISFFWYKRKKTSLRSDPGGTAPEKSSERVDSHSSKLSCVTSVNSDKVIAAIKKAKRDLETSQAIEEVASIEDEEEEVIKKSHRVKRDTKNSVGEVTATEDFEPIDLSSVLSGKEIVSETFVVSTPIKDNNTFCSISNSCDNRQIVKEQGESVVEISDCSVIVLSSDSSLSKDLELDQNSGVIDISSNKSDECVFSDSICSLNSFSKINSESKEENILTEISDSSSCTFTIEKKDNSKVSVLEQSCVKVLNDPSNEVKVNVSSNLTNGANKVVGSKKRLNKKSVKESNGSKSNKTQGKDNIKDEKSNCKHLSSPVQTDKVIDYEKMEVACSRNEQSGHNSSSSTINGNEAGLEQKLATLGLESSHSSEGGERDSANHSPAEVMLASPSMSNFSDAHSEGSSDSGKGCSDIPDISTPPPQTPAGGSSVAGDLIPSVYEFIIPQYMVGRLIGRHGVFLHDIRSKTHTHIFIKRHPDTPKLKICAIEGAQQDIEGALAMIRQKFPLRRYPNLTLEKVSFVNVMPPVCQLPTEQFQLQLIEGVNNDVILSSLLSAGHFFLQQPMHPSYQSLCHLNMVMNTVYNSPEAPILDTPVKDAICAAPTMGGWYRAQIVDVDEDNKTVDVRFLDYGGFLNLEMSALRKIRGDLMMLPFQAVECYLANVLPAGGEDAEWTEEARLFVQDLTCGQILQAYISEYTETGTPMVFLYAMYLGQVVIVNQELVNRGFAEVYPTPPAVEE